MSEKWFVYRDQKYVGPYTWNELWKEAQLGNVKPDEMIWSDSFEDWKPARAVPGLIDETAVSAEDASTVSADAISTEPILVSPDSQPARGRGNVSILTVAIIAATVLFIFSSMTALYYLFIYTGPDVAESDVEDTFNDISFVTVLPKPENANFEDDPDENDSSGEEAETDGSEDLPDDGDESTGENADDRTEPDKQPDPVEDSAPPEQEDPPADDTPEQEENEPEPEKPAEDEEEDIENDWHEADDRDTDEIDDDGDELPAEDLDYDTISWEGGTYKGTLKDEKPHGQGVWIHPKGKKYEGDYRDGRIEGQGVMTFPGGEQYSGSFRNGKAHGYGLITHPDGRRYEGDFVDGVIHGFGVMVFSGGEVYHGYLQNGKAHGQGTMYHPNGEQVSGRWVSGVLVEKDESS